uniref:CSON014490 protein n=1 Tax=Culicoides sonorensis TaxID=179676 RepID=A0A336MEN4_CULSO
MKINSEFISSRQFLKRFVIYILFVLDLKVLCSDTNNNITHLAFDGIRDGLPAAYGDFNSDELTDIFIITNNQQRVQILYGSSDSDQLFKPGFQCNFNHYDDRKITSVVPGDFDGDAFMDILITLEHEDRENYRDIFIIYGSDSEEFNCTEDTKKPVIKKMYGEPLVLDYNHDMSVDLFGLDHEKKRKFWIFGNRSKEPEVIDMEWHDQPVKNIRIPHSHAIVDINHDFNADLIISCEEGYEIWYGKPDKGFQFDQAIQLEKLQGPLLGLLSSGFYGQSVFMDVELEGRINMVVPVCWTSDCKNASLLVWDFNRKLYPYVVPISLKNPTTGDFWLFAHEKNQLYEETVTLRVGDFNLDGYPDILATLMHGGIKQTYLLKNEPYHGANHEKTLSRKFEVQWNNGFKDYGNNIIQGSFFDFYQDGTLDVILVQKNGNQYQPFAFRNSLDYDANFIKAIVLTGLKNKKSPSSMTPLGKHRRYYGSNLPGPRIEFNTTTQEGDKQHGTAAQLSQSAYCALQLPYTVFGLGRTPNFVDSLTVGLYTRHKHHSQVIPNSQIIVVPSPVDKPDQWQVQLFVTPSKLILKSVFAMSGVCLAILLIIIGLHFKEKREDKLEKLAEAHRFHFDAM